MEFPSSGPSDELLGILWEDKNLKKLSESEMDEQSRRYYELRKSKKGFFSFLKRNKKV